MKQYDPADMILPEGFDPDAEEQHFDDEVEEGTQEEVTPTTEQTPPETQPTEPTAQEEPVAPTTEPEQPVQQEEPKFRVRYNGEDRELTQDEARVFAQKGMNYDKMATRSHEQEEKLQRYEGMAKMFGFDSAEAMMTQAEQNFIDTKVQDLVSAGNTEAMARFLVQQELRANKPAAPAPAEPAAGGLTAERKAELKEFSEAYPSVTQIPDEVFRMHQEGVRLKTAYGIYTRQQEQMKALNKANSENEAAQKELAVLRQNQAAATKGPVTGTVGKAAPESPAASDPFLDGFNSQI